MNWLSLHARTLFSVFVLTLMTWNASAQGKPFNASAPATPNNTSKNRTGQAPRNSRNRALPRKTANRVASKQPAGKPITLEQGTAQDRKAFSQLIGAQWIWSSAHTKDQAPVGDVYFRKTFTLGQVEFGQVHICADNRYELFVNGRPVATGNDWRKMDVHDVTKLLKPGKNVVAAKVHNTETGPAGLVARVLTKEPASTLESSVTNSSWRTSVKQFNNWNQRNFRDKEWLPAAEYGLMGATLPWGDEIVIAKEGARFAVDPEFAIDRLASDEQTGSLIAMTFDSQGNILASQEGGPLLLVADHNQDGKFESVSVFSDQVNTAQGILSLQSSVFAVGKGPNGSALYRLDDTNRDGQADHTQTILRFRGSPGEHGPHAVRRGPDGLLYIIIGNFARVAAKPDPKSPYIIEYEGDLIEPRYEDPRGHAVGVPAPGGTVIRTDTQGSFAEVAAGGLRNPYDFAFNEDGELFTFDADMEWDLGTPWYRPTRINHVTPGAEFGWRSGWAKWPSTYIDSLPAIQQLGGGSPTGVEYYDHVMFPIRLQNKLFLGDWARGLIYAVHLEPDGASYKARCNVFLKGRPLNVTDMAVGPDGALYFCTGGRGTDGGIYRVRWKGKVPEAVTELGKGIEQAIRQPQVGADWARTKIIAVKQNLGDAWPIELAAIATDKKHSVRDRKRALELLALFGPRPTSQLLLTISEDREPDLRAYVVRLMGQRSEPDFDQRLVNLLQDPNARVRRLACEAVSHRGQQSPSNVLVGLLNDEDRFVAFAARRALEKLPAPQWQQEVLETASTRTFLQGATGLLIAYPSREVSLEILRRCESMIQGNAQNVGRPDGLLTHQSFLETLRVVQLALHRGQITPQEVPSLTKQLVYEFPTSDSAMNRELVKVLAYLDPPEAASLFAQQLAHDIPEVEKLHLAAYAPRLQSGWQTEQKLAFLQYYEKARDLKGGHSVSAYVENFARDFFTHLSLVERRQVLAVGEQYPTSALSVLARLPDNTSPDVLAEIRALDQRLASHDGDVFDRLRVGIVATLGRFPDADSTAHLYEIYRTQPERRASVAMSLTVNPSGTNWDLLVDSLKTIDGVAAGDVLHALSQVPQKPETAEPYRHVILQGLRMHDAEGELATKLLTHWTGIPNSGKTLDEQLVTWQKWYGHTFPNAPAAQLPQEVGQNKWSYEELLSFLDSEEGTSGNPVNGSKIFRTAQCSKCHRVEGQGERLGPDLTTLANRFQKKEVLESIVYPSHVVSDQYVSRAVVAGGRTYVGIATRDGAGKVIILTAGGEKVQIEEQEIEEVHTTSVSAMPAGLLNQLTLDQVADLFAFLIDRSPANVAGRTRKPGR
jgi:putative heme-binding domain-containing protein